ncbi:MAG: hypothetical protein JXA21_27240 [Anaerolineae bacterium]|nr:hypothetical protein [Anaerolineae bacterium]
MTIPVVVFLVLTAIGALFQLALALGAPWGAYTLGGKFPGQLPAKLRVAALVQILVMVVFALIVLVRAGLIFSGLYAIGRVAIWFVVVFFVLGTFANLSTPSKGERLLWGPVNVLMLMMTIIIALSA